MPSYTQCSENTSACRNLGVVSVNEPLNWDSANDTRPLRPSVAVEYFRSHVDPGRNALILGWDDPGPHRENCDSPTNYSEPQKPNYEVLRWSEGLTRERQWMKYSCEIPSPW